MQVVCVIVDCTVDRAGVDPALLQEDKSHQSGATLQTCLCMGSDAIMPRTPQCMSSWFFILMVWNRYKVIKEVYYLHSTRKCNWSSGYRTA